MDLYSLSVDFGTLLSNVPFVGPGNNKRMFFVFLTNWGFLALTLYIVWSTISVTIRYVQQLAPRCCNKICGKQKAEPKLTCSQKPIGCCDVTNDSIKWYEKIHWFLFTTGAELAVAITIIYWPLFVNNQRSDYDFYGHLNIAIHLVNGIIPFIDIWVSRIPVRLYHVIYSVGISCIYAVFTGLYYAGEGGNPFNNGTYIYPQIDYENSPGTASVFAIAIPLVYMPLIHLFFYANHLMREGLLYLVKKMCCKCLHEPADDVNNDYEMKNTKK